MATGWQVPLWIPARLRSRYAAGRYSPKDLNQPRLALYSLSGKLLELSECLDSKTGESFDKSVKDFDSSLGIVERAVCGRDLRVEKDGQSSKLAIGDFISR
jgi:hypothetical protein